MEPTNRRDFLKHASVAAAVAGAAVAAPVTIADAASALAEDKKASTVSSDAKVDRHIVAHLRDVQTGEVAIYAGDREWAARWAAGIAPARPGPETPCTAPGSRARSASFTVACARAAARLEATPQEQLRLDGMGLGPPASDLREKRRPVRGP